MMCFISSQSFNNKFPARSVRNVFDKQVFVSVIVGKFDMYLAANKTIQLVSNLTFDTFGISIKDIVEEFTTNFQLKGHLRHLLE